MEIRNFTQIQCLRGIAAILVLLFHFAPQLERYELSFLLPKIESWGFWGVDIFFVLSGFVIALSAERLQGIGQGRRFILKRSLRIFLGYWPALALWLALTMSFSAGIDVWRLVKSWFLLTGSMAEHLLPIAWTLYYELLFYFLFFLLIIFFPSNVRVWILQLLALLISAWCAGWLLISPQSVMAGEQPLRGLLSFFVVEFFMGVFIYRIRALLIGNRAIMIPLLILSMILLVVGMQSPWFDKIEILRGGTYGVSAAAIVALAVCLEGLWYSKILNKVGDASYSLYLTHILVISQVTSFVNVKMGLTSTMGQTLVLMIPLLAILLAMVWYKLIEKPLYDAAIRILKL